MMACIETADTQATFIVFPAWRKTERLSRSRFGECAKLQHAFERRVPSGFASRANIGKHWAARHSAGVSHLRLSSE
eukprot:9487025-Pyramimonas_sp.AAC.2